MLTIKSPTAKKQHKKAKKEKIQETKPEDIEKEKALEIKLYRKCQTFSSYFLGAISNTCVYYIHNFLYSKFIRRILDNIYPQHAYELLKYVLEEKYIPQDLLTYIVSRLSVTQKIR